MAYFFLDGLSVLVTRPAHQAFEFCKLLENEGARVIRCPTIKVSTTRKEEAFQDFVKYINDYDMLMFNSPNSVIFGIPLIHLNSTIPKQTLIGAIGPSTQNEINNFGYKVDIFPRSTFDSEAFLSQIEKINVKGKKIAILRAQTGRTLLGESLISKGAKVIYVEVYERTPIRPDIAGKLYENLINKIDIITITSLESFINLDCYITDKIRNNFKYSTFITGHKRISNHIKSCGFSSVYTADDPTNKAMFSAVLNTYTNLKT